MSNQTKIGLLMGLGVILLVGIIVSDHLASHSQNAIQSAGPMLTRLGESNPTNQNEQIRLEFLGPAPTPITATAFDTAAPGISTLPPVLLSMESVGSDSPPASPVISLAPAAPPAAPLPAVAALTLPPAAEPEAAPPGQSTYTIEKDDNLSKIAAKTLGSRNRWPEIKDANKALFEKSKILQIGTVLIIPAPPVAKTMPPPTVATVAAVVHHATTPPAPTPVVARAQTYTVARGDLLGTIAQKTLGSSRRVQDLVNANKKALPKGDKTILKTGMTLVIPAP